MFDSLDLKVAYQNHRESRDDLDYLIENLEEDQLPLSLDIHALHTGGIEPIAYLGKHGDRISSLHLRDYHLDGGRTVALGEGDLPFDQLKGLLQEIDFEGDLIVELILPSGLLPTDRCWTFFKVPVKSSPTDSPFSSNETCHLRPEQARTQFGTYRETLHCCNTCCIFSHTPEDLHIYMA